MPESKHRRKGKNRPREQAPKPRVQQVSQVQLELQVLQGMYNRQAQQIAFLQAQLEQLTRASMAVLLTKKDHRAVVSQAQLDKLQGFRGMAPSEDEDGNLVLELVPLEEEDDDVEQDG